MSCIQDVINNDNAPIDHFNQACAEARQRADFIESRIGEIDSLLRRVDALGIDAEQELDLRYELEAKKQSLPDARALVVTMESLLRYRKSTSECRRISRELHAAGLPDPDAGVNAPPQLPARWFN